MERKGICNNVNSCSKAGKVQSITDDYAAFNCAECGEPLMPYQGGSPTPARNGGGNAAKLILACIVALIILVAGGLGIYALLNKSSKPTAIKLDKSEITMNVGDTIVLSPTVEPENAKATFIFKKKESNVDVTTEGKVVALKAGEDAILIKCDENPDIRAICKITIAEPKAAAKSTKVKTGTKTAKIKLGYGVYEGDVKGGKPDGFGNVTFTQNKNVNNYWSAKPGYTIRNARFIQGKLQSGTLYDDENERVAFIDADNNL